MMLPSMAVQPRPSILIPWDPLIFLLPQKTKQTFCQKHKVCTLTGATVLLPQIFPLSRRSTIRCVLTFSMRCVILLHKVDHCSLSMSLSARLEAAQRLVC